MEIRYLTVEEVVDLHAIILEWTNSPPAALPRRETLESAIERPRMAAYYEQADLIAQAVLLAVGISQAQAFDDGNKRAATISTTMFLRYNGHRFLEKTEAIGRHLEFIAEVPQGPERDVAIAHFREFMAQHTQPVA